MFPVELPGLPSKRDTEFSIHLQPGAEPILIPSYRMLVPKMDKLKKQLDELQERGFIRYNV